MAVTWLLVVMAAAVFVSMVLLAVVCLHCRNKGPQTHIRQANGSEESSEFRIIHATQPTFNRCPSNLLSPYSDRPQARQPSIIYDRESNPSYENPTEEPGNHESDPDDSGYIVVLPDGEAPPANQSRASTPSSDVNDYVNIIIPSEKKKNSVHCHFGASEDKDYLNVEPMGCKGGSTSEVSATSDSNDDDDNDDDDDDDNNGDDDDDDDEDDEGNYVNVNVQDG